MQLLHTPDASFSALFNVHGRDLAGSTRVFRASSIKQGTNDRVDGRHPNTVSTNGKNEQQFRSMGGSADLSWDLGDLSFYAITGPWPRRTAWWRSICWVRRIGPTGHRFRHPDLGRLSR